jgi:hypothetical protein
MEVEMSEPEIGQTVRGGLNESRERQPNMSIGHMGLVSLLTMALVSLACGDERGVTKSSGLDTVNELASDVVEGSERSKAPDNEGKALCRTDLDCRGAGPWRTCSDGLCEVAMSGRTLMLASIDVNLPPIVRGALNETLAGVIDTGELNLLIHLDGPLSWIIQGQPSGSLDGLTTYGQSEDFGSYCGPSAIECVDDICTATFRPDATMHRMILRIRNHQIEDGESACAYQTLEIRDVEIHVVINLRPIPGITGQTQPSSVVTLTGVLPNESAAAFIMENGRSLMEHMGSAADNKGEPSPENEAATGWPIEFSALGYPVLFDNDPTAGFDSHPTESTPPTIILDGNCQ